METLSAAWNLSERSIFILVSISFDLLLGTDVAKHLDSNFDLSTAKPCRDPAVLSAYGFYIPGNTVHRVSRKTNASWRNSVPVLSEISDLDDVQVQG